MNIRDYTYQHPRLAKIIYFLTTFSIVFSSLWAFLDPLEPFGIEFLARFEIWGFIALLIVSLLISVLAVIFLTGTSRRTLPKIEIELRRKECKSKKLKPEFFREYGPYWIDFEKGYIHRQSEVDWIINKLKEEPQHAIEGEPSSGKSVLLKHIGFDLRNQGYQVFYIDCRYEAEQNVKAYFKEALEIDDAKTLIIIDNYHQQIGNCEYFLKQYRNEGIRKTKVLIATRPVTGKLESQCLEIKRLNKTEIATENISQSLINKFLKERFHLSDENMKDYSGIFSAYERDLWYLSWALKIFNPSNGEIKIGDIYKSIQGSIEAINCAEDVFLPISILNQFEISMEKRFLTDVECGMGIDEKIIDGLIEQNEIIQSETLSSVGWIRVVDLHHSSIAELIYNTCRETPLGENIKNRIEKVAGRFEERSFLLYYLIHSDLLYYVDPLSPVFQDTIIPIINSNISDNSLKKKAQTAIQNYVNSDKELEDIESYLYAFLRSDLSNEFIAELAQELELDKFARRLNESSDINRILNIFGAIQGSLLREMIIKIDLESLNSKIKDDIWAISGIIGSLANTDANISREFTQQLGISHIKDLFSDPECLSLNEMGRCYGMLAYADAALTDELLIIIKAKLQELGEMMDELAEEIPDTPNPMLDEMMNLIREAADAQSLYGNHYIIIDKLFDCIEDMLVEKIHEAKWGLVDYSGGDMSETEAFAEITQGIGEELEALFEYWNKEFLRRTFARFEITSTG